MTIGSLFSGVGGLDEGLERSGLGRVVFQCEIDPFCRKVLRKHWPDATIYEDVRSVGHGAARVDVLCGGFPCQDVSLAGLGAGLAGARSGLWYEYLRIVEELAPSIVVIENVLGLRTRGLRDVLAGLAALGFDAEWTCVSAAELGAPHIRKRIFIVATHPDRVQLRDEPGWLERSCRARAGELADDGEARASADASRERSGACGLDADAPRDGADRERSGDARAARDRGTTADAAGEGEPQQGGALGPQWRRAIDGGWRPPISPVRRVDDGIPNRSHGRRLKALGNAVVPQIPELIGRAILQARQAQ